MLQITSDLVPYSSNLQSKQLTNVLPFNNSSSQLDGTCVHENASNALPIRMARSHRIWQHRHDITWPLDRRVELSICTRMKFADPVWWASPGHLSSLSWTCKLPQTWFDSIMTVRSWPCLVEEKRILSNCCMSLPLLCSPTGLPPRRPLTMFGVWTFRLRASSWRLAMTRENACFIN